MYSCILPDDLSIYIYLVCPFVLRLRFMFSFFSRVGRHCLRDDNRWQEGFFWALCSAAGDALATPPRGPSPASFAALSCLKNFAEDEDFYERVINQVSLLFTVTCPVHLCYYLVTLLLMPT